MRRWHVGAVDRDEPMGFGRSCWTRKGALRLARRWNMLVRDSDVEWVAFGPDGRQVNG